MSDVEFKKLAKELAGKQRGSSSILLLVSSRDPLLTKIISKKIFLVSNETSCL